MSGQIKFYRKSHIDADRVSPVITVTDLTATNNGQDFIKFLRNRNNNSGWNTSGSDDAANTQILVDLGDYQNVDMIMFVRHNFKNFLIEFYDSDLGDFNTYENVIDNEVATSLFEKSIYTNQIRITITGTMVADDDKTMRQLIITQSFFNGQFEGWPQINKPTASLNKKSTKMISGKVRIVETRGAYSCELSVKLLKIDEDLTIIENIYFNREGVLMLLSGGDEDQFSSRRIGYRNEDIVLVSPTNELELPFVKNYTTGIKIKMKLVEVVR